MSTRPPTVPYTGGDSASSSSASSSSASSAFSGSDLDLPATTSTTNSGSAAQRNMDPTPRPVQVAVIRCLRCAKAEEITTTDDPSLSGMVQIGVNIYYCNRCAKMVGYT